MVEDETTTTDDESIQQPSLILNQDEPYLYSHFLKPWGQILSKQVEEEMKSLRNGDNDHATFDVRSSQ